MSEPNSTVTDNGSAPSMTAEQLAAFQAWQVKEAQRIEKAEQAKELRKRQNNRPMNADGTEMNATQAFLTVLSDLQREYARVYANDPATFVRRMEEQITPAITAVASTPSTLMAGSLDQARRLLAAYMPPADSKPVPAPSTK